MLEVRGLKKSFQGKNVLSGADFTVRPGEWVSIVGPSGAGKSTIAKILCGTQQPDEGTVLWNNALLYDVKRRYDPRMHRRIQLIPQQPYASLDPLQRALDAVAEPLRAHRLAKNTRQAKERARELLLSVGLEEELLHRRPGELSGGQAQRVLIARALTLAPDLLIADEATSMLDVTTQAQILRLFQKLRKERGLSLLLISHDRPMVDSVSDRIYELSDGKLNEIQKEEEK